MRIVVTGCAGQVVSALIERGAQAGHEIIPLGRPRLDLASPQTILPAIVEARPELIVSAAAYTAVDKAETEPALAQAVNGEGAGLVARAARVLGVPVVHLSTDYVFDGSKASPYVETDPTGPLGVYGASKLAGEQRVAAETDNHAIVRVAWVYSPFGANFVKTMLRLAETRDEINVVADQWGGPTSAFDIADAVLAIGVRLVADPSKELRGIFHLSPVGEASWADFACAIFQGARARGARFCKVNRIPTTQYPTPARRPENSRLSGVKVARVYGVALPDWTTSLEVCLDRLIGPRS
jgi:dTDP-4-dehydrorhamnose reductase